MLLTPRLHKDCIYVSIGRDRYAPGTKARVFIVQKLCDWNTRHGVFFRSEIRDGRRIRQCTLTAFGRVLFTTRPA